MPAFELNAALKKYSNRNLKPALAKWCLHNLADQWSMEKICETAIELQVPAIEVVAPDEFHLLKKYGLDCALTLSHLFVRGMNNPLHWDECITDLTKCIDANAEYGFQNIVTFTGFADTSGAEKGSLVSSEQGIKNCVEGFKKIVGYAEKKKSVLVLEPLNSRDGAEMKGHPGYQGDHLDYCMEIIKQVSSPSLKLLFDVYHIQIMDGDIIRRMKEVAPFIGHVQVAGNPGRGEMDENQELNYKGVMRALAAMGYKGYVGLEFIPTRDPMTSLIEALDILEV